MNAREAQRELGKLFSEIFGKDNVKHEWRSNAKAEDWLRFSDIYAPRPDIAIGPFNIQNGSQIQEIEDSFKQHQNFFSQLEINNNIFI